MFTTVGIILILGMGWTVFFDYRPWVKAEKVNFGQGPGEQGTVGATNKMFQENGASVRIGYPEGWQVSSVWESKTWFPKTDVAIFTPPDDKQVKLTITRFTKKGSLVDIVDAEVEAKKALGWIPFGERQYVNGVEDVTIVTWQVKQNDKTLIMVQEALAKSGDKLVIVRAESDQTNWKQYSNIFWEMYKSLVII